MRRSTPRTQSQACITLQTRYVTLSVTAQRTGAGLSGAPGVALAPRLQLYVHYVAPCRASRGCRAPMSLSGVSMAQRACDVRVVCWFFLQRDEIVGKGVTAQTTAGNPKRHTPRRKASPRARTNGARTGAHKQGPKQPATRRNTECALRRREQSNTHNIKQPYVQPKQKHNTTP